MRLLTVALLMASSSAFACPELAGTYAACVSQTSNETNSTNMVVTQKIVKKVMTYTMESVDSETNEIVTEVYSADGKTKYASETDPETGLKLEVASKVQCDAKKAINMEMTVTFAGEKAAHLLTTVTKVGNQLTIATTGESMGEAVSETVICE